MGLTKQYLRYVPAGNFNIIASQNCNNVFVTLESQEGRFLAVGACEHVIIWDLRLGEKAQVLSGENSPVTCICASPSKRHLAVGYADGNIQVFDLKSADIVSTFAGHRSEVTALAYDNFGHKLASGSKDTEIIVWDTVAETGICRLSGHKGPITQLIFMMNQPVLLSSSKDTFIKFWDLDTKHCFKTLVGHRTEVWGIALMKDDKYLVSGCSDAELRVWKLVNRDDVKSINNLAAKLELTSLHDDDDPTHPLQCHKTGSFLRAGRGRVVSLFSDLTGQVIGCIGTDAQVELFYFCTDEESQKRHKKRLKKEKKKKESMEQDEDMETDVVKIEDENMQLSLKDEVKRLAAIKLSSKPKSVNLVLGNGGELRASVTLSNNTIELYSVQTSNTNVEAKCLRSITNHGHNSDVKAVSFSSDNLAIVSGSNESVKMWNRPTQSCLRTVKTTGQVLSTLFVPGDRHVLAGLKNGHLLIIDIAAGDILEEIPAHTGELYSISLQPDLRGVVTGGADKTVKFWNFELVVDEKSESKAKVLSLLHTRTLKLEEGVLCVKMSPNSKFIAVALMDSTVKIFFVDTFKFYLSLYGHKLPVVSLDISSDSNLIVTGSGDRNVKLWGMDFGDCHKSIFAHDDTITCVQFVPRTHYFFTCGKDGKIKQWDGDSFDKIITLNGHSGEATNLSVSPNGQFVVSCGNDRVLRMFEKTDQIVVLEDEEETEREQQEALATGEQTVVAGQPGLNLPSKKTIGSEKGAENILECLEIMEKFREQLAEHAALQAASTQQIPLPNPPLLMQALNVTTPEDFLLETIKRIRASDLEETLLILPFTSVCTILQNLPILLKRGDQIEIICRIAMFLLKIHHAPIIANQALLSTMQEIQKLATGRVHELRDLVGYNYHGMQFIQRELEAAEGVQLFRDATIERKKGEKKRKKRETLKRAIMTLNA